MRDKKNKKGAGRKGFYGQSKRVTYTLPAKKFDEVNNIIKRLLDGYKIKGV